MPILSRLATTNHDYECVMVPVKPKMLKSKKYTAIVDGTWVEWFSMDKRGKKKRNGILFFVPK